MGSGGGGSCTQVQITSWIPGGSAPASWVGGGRCLNQKPHKSGLQRVSFT